MLAMRTVASNPLRIFASIVVLLVAAGSAIAQQSPAETTPAETARIQSALSPFFTIHQSFSPPTTAVEGMPADIDPFIGLILRTMNRDRVQAGLPPYRYDNSLTAMAMAHVHYMLENCNTAPMAHYELKNLPGYTAAGDEAAATSGLAFGDNTPYGSLELLAGAYHRIQFLDPTETRIGYGFGSSSQQGCSVGLFVTRPPATNGSTATAARQTRFILFPGPDATDVPTAYMEGETPDPRPNVPVDASGNEVDTGYPITISLSYDDADAFRSAQVTLTDASGHDVPFWESDPTHPSQSTAPDIYGPGVDAAPAFQSNYDAVFIMPRQPLLRSTRYTVDARLQIGGNESHLHWSFSTTAATIWEVRPDASTPWETLSGALQIAMPGDIIQLAPGSYTSRDVLYPGNLRIIGAGVGKTVINLRIDPASQYTPVEFFAPGVVENLTFNSPGAIFYTSNASTVLFNNVALTGGNGQDTVATIDQGSTVLLENVDTSSFRSDYLFYADSSQGNSSSPAGTLFTYHLKTAPKLYQLIYGSLTDIPLTKPIDAGASPIQ